MLNDLARDLRHALRLLRRNPAFAIVVVSTLALAIGASVTVFSILDSFLLRPLNFSRPDRLVVGLYATKERPTEPAVFALYRDYLAWTARSRSFDTLAAAFPRAYLVGGAGDAATADGLVVTPEFFRALGASARLGRTLSAQDATGPAAAVLSYGLWQRQFGGLETVLGTRVILNGVPHEIVGIMPADFDMRLLDQARGFDLWTLFRPGEAAYAPGGTGGVAVIGRIRDGATAAGAQAELNAIHHEVEAGYTPNAARFEVLLSSLQADNTRTVRATLVTLGGAVAALLLVACLNVGTLLVGRSLVRARDTAIRAAIGSGRGRLVRQFLAESLLLSASGGAGGVALAVVATRLFTAWNPLERLPASTIQIDLRALAIAAALTALATMVSGLVPALRMAAADPADALRGGGARGASGAGRSRAQAILLAVQMAMSVVLLVTTMLLVRSFVRLQQEPLGFDAANLTVVKLALPADEFDSGASRNAFYGQLADRLAARPGVRMVAAGTSPLLSSGPPMPVRTSAGESDAPLRISVQDVTANFFDTLGAARIAGRLFAVGDAATAPPVVVLNERAAQLLFGPPAAAVGRRIRLGLGGWAEVVGVVANTRSTAFNTLEWLTSPVAYVPAAQGFTSIRNPTSPSFELHVHVRTSRPVSLPEMRASVAPLNRRVAVTEVRTAAESIARATRQPALRMRLLGAFAFASLLLAAIGAYGLVSQSIAQQMQEIGIRLALGARPGTLAREIARQTVMAGTIGVGCGAVAAFALAKPLESLLYGVRATDAVSFASAGAVLVAVTAVAALIPALGAMRIDPIEVLRAE
jgi:predicted permease